MCKLTITYPCFQFAAIHILILFFIFARDSNPIIIAGVYIILLGDVVHMTCSQNEMKVHKRLIY